MIGQKDSFKRLRYYAVAAITNQDSKEIIVRAVGTDDIPEWKESIWVGIGTYDQLNEPGVALLGTYLASTSKQALTRITMLRCTIFLESGISAHTAQGRLRGSPSCWRSGLHV